MCTDKHFVLIIQDIFQNGRHGCNGEHVCIKISSSYCQVVDMANQKVRLIR